MQQRLFLKMLVHIILLVYHMAPISSRCAMSGECDRHTNLAGTPHAYSVPQDPLDYVPALGYEQLFRYCPYLDGFSSLCCTPNQASELHTQLGVVKSIIGRCPSCFYNFARIWCDFVCSPNQSDFISMTHNVDHVDGRSCADVVRYNISREFAEAAFDACKDVRLSSDKALALMIGTRNITLANFYSFIGRRNINYGAVLQINFSLTDTDVRRVPISNDGQPILQFQPPPYLKCFEPAGPDEPACSVLDCKKNLNQSFFITAELGDVRLRLQIPLMFEFQLDLSSVGFNDLSIDWFLKAGASIFFIFIVLVFLKIVLRKTSVKKRKKKKKKKNAIGMNCDEPAVFDGFCRFFSSLVARFPKILMMIGGIIAIIACLGNIYFTRQLEISDAWSTNTSTTRLNRLAFERLFGKLMRYEQIIIKAFSRGTEAFYLSGGIFKDQIYRDMFDLIERIKNLKTKEHGVTLGDICYRPFGVSHDCVIMSPTNYFQNNLTKYETAQILNEDDDIDFFTTLPKWKHLENCISEPFMTNTSVGYTCFGSFGGPIEPKYVFSDIPASATSHYKYALANVAIITIPVVGNAEHAVEWEGAFIETMRAFNSSLVDVSFMAESSIGDELRREGINDIPVVIIACASVLTWLLVALGCGGTSTMTRLDLRSKCTLGFLTIFASVVSVWCTIGVFSFNNVHAADNVILVIFFVVTCVGINKIFLTVGKFQEQTIMSDDIIKNRLIHVMAEMIPVILTTSLISSLCFLLGTGAPFLPIDMPLVENLARHMSVAIIFDMIFYHLVILPIFYIDTMRSFKTNERRMTLLRDLTPGNDATEIGRIARLARLIRATIHWILRSPRFRRFLCGTYFLITAVSAWLAFQVEPSFDQSSTFSSSSYLSKYFSYLDHYGPTGPQVYFVVDGLLDWSNRTIQNRLCTLPGCSDYSIGNILAGFGDRNTSPLSGDVTNFIDNYLQFLYPDTRCCLVNETDGSYCMPGAIDCATCLIAKHPTSDEFHAHFHHFLNVVPSKLCPFGGLPDAPSISLDGDLIKGAYFMTFFNKLDLSNTTSMYRAMASANLVADKLQRILNVDGVRVFAYSSFFPYYEQFMTTGSTLISLLLIVLLVLLITVAIFHKAGICGCVISVVVLFGSFVHLILWMHLFGIGLNVLSINNIAMSLGIVVDIIIPVLHAFYNSRKTQSLDRAIEAVDIAGAAILSGIIATVLIGTGVLLFAGLPILKMYYCHQLLGISAVGTINGIIILPALLSETPNVAIAFEELSHSGVKLIDENSESSQQ
ncbi:unnamed protein product [Caenorhabditis bovis]|uniref:SSD domain-containing protein n=1 Tax=Caenorhabditis bovis TaxID=2654633 RepID=A0A8S1EPX2_9PELO|nr:unnamed protein product [Caenorhabditis bovis]